jgi:hypothetical protein
MAAYGWIVRKFIRNGEVTPDKLQFNVSPSATALVGGAAAVVAVPGTMYSIGYSVPAGAATYKFSMPFKCEILDIEAVKAGGNASIVASQDTLTFKNGVGGANIAILDLQNQTFSGGAGTGKRALIWGAGSPVVPAGGIVEIAVIQTTNSACSFTVHFVASP